MKNLTLAFAAMGIVGVASSQAAVAYGLTTQNALVTFDTAVPSTITSSVALDGLAAGESILGIDVRPATGQIYALGSSRRLYTVSPVTGALTQVGSQFSTVLNGSSYGFDFNPMIDRIRVVSNTDTNYVINPNDGTITTATTLFYGPGDSNAGVNPSIVGSAYSNNFAGTTSTQLYGIDSVRDILVTQANSAGTLGTVGALGINVTDLVGFDIAGGVAYLAATAANNDTSKLYTVNLVNGATTLVGEIGGGALISDITLAAVPEPTSLAFIGGVALLGLRRRSR